MNESIEHIELNEFVLEIATKIDNLKEMQEPYDHSAWNWTSQIGHPCLKNLVHQRLDWKKRQMIDLDGLYRVEEGRKQEWEMKKFLGDAGFEVGKTQKRYTIDEYKISGKIDGLIAVPERFKSIFKECKELPIEVKTVNPYYWNSTKSILDIKQHPKFWIRGILSQLNTYFVMTKAPGGILALKTFGQRPRILPMMFDQELADRDFSQAKKVNEHVENKVYPNPIPFEPDVCGLCDFNHICKPLGTSKMIEVNDPGLIFKLEEYLSYKKQAEIFKELQKELIGDKKKPGIFYGKDALVEDIEIKTKRWERKTYDIPKEEKEKFFTGKEETISTSIDRIGK